MLETERLILKPHTMDNLNKMNKWRNDNELLYYDGDCPEVVVPIPMESTTRYLEYIINNQDDENIRYGIHRKVDDELIGFCIIAFIDRYNRNCRFGITIGEKDQWGKGYGSEIIKEVKRYCFLELNMNKIGVELYSFNERSKRLFEGAGFKREGILREKVFKNGRFEDEYVYGLLREEWEGDL